MHLTSHITHSNGYAPYIAYYRSNGYDQRFRKLKPKPKLNPPNAHRSQIKICENRQTQNVQFRLMPNAFRILKPIQKSSKRVWVFRNTGANAFAKNQMRLAYEDKRDLYCTCLCWCQDIYRIIARQSSNQSSKSSSNHCDCNHYMQSLYIYILNCNYVHMNVMLNVVEKYIWFDLIWFDYNPLFFMSLPSYDSFKM